jgi:shikimate kinase
LAQESKSDTNSDSNLILVGFMATGKSQVGRILSQITGWPFVDADDEIVRRSGRSIQRIFDESGEAAFRDLERLVVADLCAGRRRIIAAGGGAFAGADNQRLMLASGLVVCLSAAPETIHSRLGAAEGGVRPLLARGPAGDHSGESQIELIKGLLTQRAAAYTRAHYCVETDSLTPQQVAERILEILISRGFSGG